MKPKILLTAILTLALFLRTWQISLLPFGFTPDEASFGYDAYSILNTGRDQWGHLLPLTLESFGDFKLPLYSYLTIPTVALFGLDIFATRFPNAIIGTLAVLATYLMVRKFLKIGNTSSISLWNLDILASAILAISPWHIMMSRGAFEANLTTFLMPFGIYLFLKGLEGSKYLVLSALIFGLNLFSYHSARLVTPLIVLLLIFFFRKELLGNIGLYKSILQKKFSILIFGIFLTLALYTLLIGGGRRAQDIVIFAGATESAHNERFPYIYQGVSQNAARIFVNRYQVVAKRFFENYFQYLSPKFLFIDGPSEATYGMIPGRGVMYSFEFLFLLFFFYSLSKSKNKSFHLFVLAWVLIAPIPAALTMGRGYTANRAEIMLPALTTMSAIGLLALHSFLKIRISNKFLITTYAAMFLYSFCSFCVDYYIVSPFKTSKAMLWGNLEVATWLSDNTNGMNVIVSRKLSEPHIYVAFANAWDVVEYQKNSKFWGVYREKKLKFLDQLGEYELGNYKFAEVDYNLYGSLPNTLLVGRPEEFPDNSHYVAKFISPSGEPTVVVVEAAKEIYANKL